MHPAGLAAFQKREGKRSAIYAYEQRRDAKLSAAYEKKFRANKAAWKFFQAQVPWYRRTCSWWVVSAKKDETKLKRLAALMEHSEHQRTLPQLTRPTGKNKNAPP
jgi:uncharacterized protein YdeI (YjbR/CyaY-like superfamily)